LRSAERAVTFAWREGDTLTLRTRLHRCGREPGGLADVGALVCTGRRSHELTERCDDSLPSIRSKNAVALSPAVRSAS